MLAGAVLNPILNYLLILRWGPWGVTPASFLSLMLVFLLRAYSTRGLLEIDFHPVWLVLNLALVLAEIWCMMNLTHWALPVVGITAVVCVLNIREVLSMLDTLIRGAKIIDGTGKAAFNADVGIRDGMIEAVGNLPDAQAFSTIEAAGRCLTPGFIDMHRHADAAVFRKDFGRAEL